VRKRGSILSLKLTICLIGGMAIIFSLLGYRTVRLNRRHLEDITFASGDRISETIRRSTRYGMLNNHSEQVRETIKAIATQPGINRIRIFNEIGEVRLSSDEHDSVTRMDKRGEACLACHSAAQPLAKVNRADRMRIFTTSGGERVLGLINPIENEPSCYNASCHAHPPDKKILGVVDVTLSLAGVDESIAEGGRQLIGTFVIAIVIISLMVGALVWVMVHKPVKQLIFGTKRVAAGDLDYKLDVSSRDEVGELATSFNRMTEELKRADSEVKYWAKTLESRVEEKTAELNQAHSHILRVEKLASVGKLAAIVAHEINNPLAGILVYSKLLLKKLGKNGGPPESGNEQAEYLSMIASESARCGDIVKSLLQFSKQAPVNLASTDLNEVIRQSVRLVQHKIDLMGIRTELTLDEALPAIVCDAQHIKQALVALFINACEAMKPEEGVLRIESRRIETVRMVEIVVGDNGIGMDDETRKRIFEPFFTTKEQGRGVGLGLAVVYGIVNSHSGEIDVESCPERGTVFRLRLPEEPPKENQGRESR
jgi:two-component system NtrC family sensor kinase